jgi:hypothetical protein
MFTGAVGAALIAALLSVTAAAAQDKPLRIRGTIETQEAGVYVVKTRAGDALRLRLAEKAVVRGVVKATLEDIKVGSYIGVSALPQPEGHLRALHVHIFPDDMRGTAEGHFPWDNQPGATMTNAAVESHVAARDGPMLTVKYKTGEQKILVPAGTPIVGYVAGSRDDLKPGTAIFVVAATRLPDGSYETRSVAVGRDGLIPPM